MKSIKYAVRFLDGQYFSWETKAEEPCSKSLSLEEAALYNDVAYIEKDFYLLEYLLRNNLSYEVVKVELETTFRVAETVQNVCEQGA